MCGIVGIYNAGQHDGRDSQLVNNILADQFNRGPDHQQSIAIQSANVCTIFGHNRLSILDLSDQANQPMWDAQEDLCITFNGQIYNYVELKAQLSSDYSFKTHSDTEVLIYAFRKWREDCVKYLRGMFAFAILEKSTGQIWLFRDRFGVKPLFYLIQQNKLFFASSTYVIAQHFHLEPNYDYVTKGLRFRFYEDDSEATPYDRLYSLQPGHFLTAKLEQSQLKYDIKRYYFLEAHVEEKASTLGDLSEADLVEKVSNTLIEALKIRMRADVPIGIALSGGLDSSTIATLLSQFKHANMQNAFTFGDPNRKRSEGPVVAKLANKLGIKTKFVCPEPKYFAEGFWATLKAQGAPFPSCSIIAQYLIYQAAHQQGIKVLLSGQGADEAFLGYRKFQFYYLRDAMAKRNIKTAIQHFLGVSLSMLHQLTQYRTLYPYFSRYLRKEGIQSNLSLPVSNVGIHQRNGKLNLPDQQLFDVLKFSLPTLLRYEDRNSMANSVESRLPFVDHELMELALALPEALKIRFGYGKWIIREMMNGQLTDQIRLARFKRGFDADDSFWIDNGLGDLLRESLNNLPIRDYLPKDTKINTLFSNARLKFAPNNFAEAVSLIWLGMNAKDTLASSLNS